MNDVIIKRLLIILLFGLFLIRIPGIFWLISSKNDHPIPYHLDEGTALTIMNGIRQKPLNPAYQFPQHKSIFYYYLSAAAGYSAYHIFPFLKKYIPEFSTFKRLQNNVIGIYALISGRLISVLASIGTVILVYVSLVMFVSKPWALIGAVLMGFNPAMMIHDHFLTSNALLTFLNFFAFYWALKIMKDQKISYYIYAGIFVGLAIGAKYTGFLSWLPLCTVQGIIMLEHIKERRILLKLTGYFLLFCAIVPLAILVSSPPLILDYRTVVPGHSNFAVLFNAIKYFKYDFLMPSTALFWGSGCLVFVVFIINIVFLTIYKKWEKHHIVALMSIIAFIFLFAGIPFFASSSRLLPVHALMIFFVISSSSTMIQAIPQIKRAVFSAIGLGCLSSILCGLFLYALSLLTPVQIKASEWIQKNISPGSSIGIFYPPLYIDPGILFTQYHGSGTHWVSTGKIYSVKIVNSLDDITHKQFDFIVVSGERGDYPEESRIMKDFERIERNVPKNRDWHEGSGYLYQPVICFEAAASRIFKNINVSWLNTHARLDVYIPSKITIYKKT